MPAPHFPPLPLITGDLMLETFSHKSLNLDYDPEISTDNERLIELGRTMLEFAVTRYLYLKRPIVEASSVSSLRENILSLENYETWVGHYNLRQRLRYIQSETLDITSPDETRQLFQAYVGAVVAQSGPNVAANWVTQLIDPDTAAHLGSDESPDTEDHRASKRPRAQPAPPQTPPPPGPVGGAPPGVTAVNTPNPANYGAAQVTSSHAATASPPIKSPGISNPTAPKQIKYLPLFNQRCSQQHLKVDYPAENRASSHAPLWTIKCLVNGVQKGEGQGASKQSAKEEAAERAYYAMGWAAYGLPSY